MHPRQLDKWAKDLNKQRLENQSQWKARLNKWNKKGKKVRYLFIHLDENINVFLFSLFLQYNL